MQASVVAHPHSPSADMRDTLRSAIAQLEHVLPAQAPIKDFVHHNTLHGFQHLPFVQALKAARQLTGASGYLAEEQFRDLYAKGRVKPEDLENAMADDPDLGADDPIGATAGGLLLRRDIYRAALLHPLKPVTACQLTWQIEELDALRRFQPDVAQESRVRLRERAGSSGGEAAAIADLWNACLGVLGLEHFLLHPEDLMDLSPERAERMLSDLLPDGLDARGGAVQRLVGREAEHWLQNLLARVGPELTLRGLLISITGEDILDEIRPVLLRHLASYLDQGLAAWHNPDRDRGFYRAWRDSARHDLVGVFEDLPDWQDHLESLPEDALGTIAIELTRLTLPRDRWAGYLKRLALELPGWSGMWMWRSLRPGYAGQRQVAVDMADYLAVRVVLEHLYGQRLSRRLWRAEATLATLRHHLRGSRAEFAVRYALFNTRLPEYLAGQAQRLIAGHREGRPDLDGESWLQLAHLIWTWRRSPAADTGEGHSVLRSGWRLFRLCQHLGLCAAEVRALGRPGVEGMLDCLDRLDPDRAGFIWLQAYEWHYRDQVFNALANNHGRCRTQCPPQAQVVFCMDDREEGLRRHLEEANPAVQTFGAAGFFGVAINWRGLDDSQVTPLCPVVVRPSHEVREVPREGQDKVARAHRRRRELRLRAKDLVLQESRRDLAGGALVTALAAPAALGVLAAKVLWPLGVARVGESLRKRFDLRVATQVAVSAPDDGSAATVECNRLGFTDAEQADRVQSLLRTIGLVSGFAPIVALVGHGSVSQNNPHVAAYDCGACSGRHGGPNARVFAVMANRPEVRTLLRGRGIDIPDDAWFVGAEHNTCDDAIHWFDLDQAPQRFAGGLQRLQSDLAEATRGSAQERCRRFASAPANPSRSRALAHVARRAVDFSQARPELGHATNAAAFIGRRAMSRGVFFDRRVFLVSYDPDTDPDGQVLESLLLAVGPVGAGINLEYYFSTVDNDCYGSGTKVLHNVAGLFGVMEGASSDLRTGLPRQMISVHEAMRLQVVVEHRTQVVGNIYQRQAPLRELVGNGWLLLSVMDPDSGAISVFKPAVGFEPWAGRVEPLPRVACSADWYAGHHGPLSPALIEPQGAGHA